MKPATRRQATGDSLRREAADVINVCYPKRKSGEGFQPLARPCFGFVRSARSLTRTNLGPSPGPTPRDDLRNASLSARRPQVRAGR